MAQAAIRWVRAARCPGPDDHRLAVRVLDTIDGPDLGRHIHRRGSAPRGRHRNGTALAVRVPARRNQSIRRSAVGRSPAQGVADSPATRSESFSELVGVRPMVSADEEELRSGRAWIRRVGAASGRISRFWGPVQDLGRRLAKRFSASMTTPTLFLPGMEGTSRRQSNADCGSTRKEMTNTRRSS